MLNKVTLMIASLSGELLFFIVPPSFDPASQIRGLLLVSLKGTKCLLMLDWWVSLTLNRMV